MPMMMRASDPPMKWRRPEPLAKSGVFVVIRVLPIRNCYWLWVKRIEIYDPNWVILNDPFRIKKNLSYGHG